ncbi:LysR family transcriptional regulator [Acetobacter aceti]|uniref:helix-turn-helix domain-containing protein n=1 Tax=Acetobacter aceti TaxID=435 RepID=UPI0038D0FCB6
MRRPPLDLRELLAVRVIASEGSIHGTARMLGGKQSALSRSMGLLEERLPAPCRQDRTPEAVLPGQGWPVRSRPSASNRSRMIGPPTAR